jgi:Fur family transcriptional regulator, peroxide stress response regulator
MIPLETFTTTLKEAGMRLTPQRIAICRLLSESRDHPTASKIHQQLQAQYPSLSLMTVYNTLNTLVHLGVVNVLGHAGDDNVHYDGDTSPHINLACVSCHQIVDIPSASIADLNGEVSANSGFKVLGARVLYYGLCPKCQKSTVQ